MMIVTILLSALAIAASTAGGALIFARSKSREAIQAYNALIDERHAATTRRVRFPGLQATITTLPTPQAVKGEVEVNMGSMTLRRFRFDGGDQRSWARRRAEEVRDMLNDAL